MRIFHLPLLIVTMLAAGSALGQKVELLNNQPFDIRMPVRLRDVKLNGQPSPIAQQLGGDLIVLADIQAYKLRTLALESSDPVAEPDDATRVELKAADHGVAI